MLLHRGGGRHSLWQDVAVRGHHSSDRVPLSGTAARERLRGRKIAHGPRGARQLLLSLDSFYLPRESMARTDDGALNFDVPAAFDIDLVLACMQKLVVKRCAVDIPQVSGLWGRRRVGGLTARGQYDFVSSSRVGWERVEPADVVILEGILVLFWEELRSLMSLKLFVDTASDTRLARRVLRDTHERGRTLENVLVQYETLVKPAFDNFVYPCKEYADLIIPNGPANTAAVLVIVEHVRGKIEQAKDNKRRLEEIEASLSASRKEHDPLDQLISSSDKVKN